MTEQRPLEFLQNSEAFPIMVRNAKRDPGGPLAPTWHVDHAAVAVLHDVAGLTVNPTGGDAVNRKEVEPHL